jgi:hypothetical protein
MSKRQCALRNFGIHTYYDTVPSLKTTLWVWPPAFAQILCTHQGCTIFKNITTISKFYAPKDDEKLRSEHVHILGAILKDLHALAISRLGILHGYMFIWGHAVPQLRHCATSRKVAGLIPDSVIGIFYWHNPRPHYGPGVDSASHRNEHQKYILGGKGGRCIGLRTLPP